MAVAIDTAMRAGWTEIEGGPLGAAYRYWPAASAWQ